MSEAILLNLPLADERSARPVAPLRRRTDAADRPALEVTWARHTDEVREAQRLRFTVFAGEMGARLTPPPGTPAGLDVDMFDEHCEHLLVRTLETSQRPSRLVGTYRVMMPAAAERLGGYYSETEFDLAPLHRLRPYMAELGRSCVDAEFRTGGVILMMWSKLAEFMNANGVAAMIGCASIPMADGGHAAASLWQRLKDQHLVPEGQRVTPKLALPVQALRNDMDVEAPPLIKGYLKCGARILGMPAWDPDFNTADLPMLLRLSDLPDAYRRRFLGG
ncbi:MAG: GNAT family N-acyltransferase [Pseudomonadota bacterium]